MTPSKILYRKFALARLLGVDHRTIDRLMMIPTANAADGRPLYDLASARKQYDAHIAGKKQLERKQASA
jgi:hypothetical protein